MRSGWLVGLVCVPGLASGASVGRAGRACQAGPGSSQLIVSAPLPTAVSTPSPEHRDSVTRLSEQEHRGIRGIRGTRVR